MKNVKIWATLVCLVFVATAVPSVSATTSAIGTLSTVSDNGGKVLVERNMTAADVSDMIGLTLDKDDTFYVSYYNLTGVLTHTSFSAIEDSDDVVWFNLSITAMNASKRLIYFDDEAITAANFNDAGEALYVNDSISETSFVFIVTIPDGVKFTYGKYSYEYDADDNGTLVVYDEDGDDVGNITSYNYSSTYKVYGMNYSDEDSSHQLVIAAKDIHDSATSTTGSRITTNSWIPYMDTVESYTMNTETTSDYNLFTSDDGYVAFDVYNDYGMLSKYTGGKTPFRMTATGLQYGVSKWYWPWSHTWTDVSTSEATISNLNIGIVEYIYLVKADSSSDDDDIVKENYGVITAIGEATSTTGIFNKIKMWTTRTPKVLVDTDNVLFG